MNIDGIGAENEVDTNDLELLEFSVGDEHFGINIAKVSEIIIHCEVTHVPNAPSAVEGVFMHRNKLVTVIDLHKVLDIPRPDIERTLLVVCDFAQVSVAFDVSNVNGIQRLKWTQVEMPPSVSGKSDDGLATGIAKIDEKIMMILDFEKIVCDMNSGQEFELGTVGEIAIPPNFDFERKIIVIDDSIFLNKVIVTELRKCGFDNISSFYNGKEAWNYISSLKDDDEGVETLGTIGAIITDIEMPLMDGHTLLRLIRNDKVLAKTPVIMFSSLIHDNVRQKGDEEGADAQFSRCQLHACIKKIVDLMSENKTSDK
ncbi:MAG: chemotaxis protein [Oscillospiraceae bacterium]|nr:chemotaxis protein [Oscillospiraceae bacterium]